jgi:integrase
MIRPQARAGKQRRNLTTPTGRPLKVAATTLGLSGDGPRSRASADELLKLASGDDFARWEAQLATTGNCANPVRLRGRIDAIDRATGEKAAIYDTFSEPGGVLRGEVLGLRWDDIDVDSGTIQIRQQLQRVRGELFLAPVKTQAGQRGLPLLDVAEQALKLQAERQALCRIDMGSAWPETGLVFTARTGRAGRTAQLRPVLPAHLRRQ